MKKLIAICVVLFLVAGAVFAQQQRFRNGTQRGTGTSYNAATRGHDGSLTVEVAFRGNRIQSINILNYTDTPAFITMIERALIPAIISAQSVEVDNVAGATVTARGVKQAVAEAMSRARR